LVDGLKQGKSIMSKVITKYVCGFAFSPNHTLVYLIRKKRPTWQAGKLNGIGGKVNIGESPIQAIVREFKEECGVVTTESDWRVVEISEHYGDAQVLYFTTTLDYKQRPETTTDELVVEYPWKIFSPAKWGKIGVLQNLPYLINKAGCMLTLKNEKGI
jgi:8-oxo-dGTP diphosphatase